MKAAIIFCNIFYYFVFITLNNSLENKSTQAEEGDEDRKKKVKRKRNFHHNRNIEKCRK